MTLKDMKEINAFKFAEIPFLLITANISFPMVFMLYVYVINTVQD